LPTHFKKPLYDIALEQLPAVLQAEDARQLHGEIRAKLIKNLKSGDEDPKAELNRFFSLIDVDGSNKLRSK